jgi:uncharacterized protein
MKTNICTFLLLFSSLVTVAQTIDTMLCQGNYWTEDEANLVMKQFAREWHNMESWEKRTGIIRNGIIKGMKLDHMPVITGNFNAIVRNTRKFDGYIVENIAIESFPGFYITGNLYRPVGEDKKFAAVLCPHGHWGNGRMMPDMQYLCASLARMGAVVFAYDMIGYGESVQTTHKMPIALLLQTWNGKRVLEYLLSRPDVDTSRVGITGASGGGTQTIMLTAIDPRITASVPVVSVSAHFFGGCVCESGMPVHRSVDHQTNNVEIAALCAPRPLMLVSDGADWTHNTPKIEYPYIQRVYALYNAEHKVDNVHLAGEVHDYGSSKRLAVYLFFAHHLKLNYKALPIDGGIKEDFVTILPVNELKVFTAENPMPSDAIMGDKAVMERLGF